MKTRFADTSLFVAFLNRRDENHTSAVDFMENYDGRIVTTEWVLAELGNYLAEGSARKLLAPFIHELRADRRFQILPANHALFNAGLELYESRPDKNWSITDCISFVVMRRRKITEALTSDHHFEQAGFRALLS